MTCLFSISKHHNKTCTYIDIQKNNKKPIWKYKNMHLCKLSLTHFNFLRQPWILYSFSTLQSCLNSSRQKSWLFFQLGTLCKNSLRKLSMTHFNFLRPSWILSSFTTILSTQNCSRKKWLFFQLGTLCIWILP